MCSCFYVTGIIDRGHTVFVVSVCVSVCVSSTLTLFNAILFIYICIENIIQEK